MMMTISLRFSETSRRKVMLLLFDFVLDLDDLRQAQQFRADLQAGLLGGSQVDFQLHAVLAVHESNNAPFAGKRIGLAPRNGLRVCGKKFFSDDVMKRMWQDFISASFLACFAGRSAWRRPGVSSPRNSSAPLNRLISSFRPLTVLPWSLSNSGPKGSLPTTPRMIGDLAWEKDQ